MVMDCIFSNDIVVRWLCAKVGRWFGNEKRVMCAMTALLYISGTP